MSFAEKWAAIEAARFEERTPIRIIRTIRTIQSEGNSANTANIANRVSTLKTVCPTPRTDLAPSPGISPGGPVRPSREACQAQGCAMWTSGGRDDPGVTWRCIGSMVHGGADPETAHKPRLANLDNCPYGQLGGTGLDDWPEYPPQDVDFAAYEAAGSLLDLARRHGLRVEVTGGKTRIVYPVGAPEALVEYAELLLAEGRSYILSMKNMVAEAPEVMQ